MKTFKLLLAAAIILTAVSCTKEISDLPQVSKSDNIYQYGTMQKFLNREFEGTLTIKDLKTHGDFGLGTYNSVDGEMVVSDGKVYRIKTTGEAQEVGDSEISPFTVVKFFKADTSFVLD
ncbi:MAG: acetolactate decarboxylase, partial [Melioribacteraceae bacterium]